jgi:hypothetical protein
MSVETISERKITPEELYQLLRKASDTELKYLLILKREERTAGCGYIYTYSEEISVIYGDAELITLALSRPVDCLWREKILVIPRSVPAVVVKKYRDKNPEVSNRDTFYIFTSEGWKSLEVEVPK